MNKSLQEILRKYYPLIVIFLFSVFFTKQLFYKDFLLFSEEKGFINYDFVNYRYPSMWDYSTNFGGITVGYLNIFTVGTFWKIGHMLNLSLFEIEWLFFFMMAFVTLFFSFLVFKKVSGNKIISLLLSIIYLTTYHYYATLVGTPKIIHYALLPISLFFWLMFSETYKVRYLLLNSLVLIFSLGIAANIPQMLGAYSFIFFYILFFSFGKENFKKIALFAIVYLLNLCFAFIPYYLMITNNSGLVQTNVLNNSFMAAGSKLRDIYRFFGAWWDYAGYAGLHYNHLFDYYHSLVGRLITYIPLIIFLLLLIKSNHKIIKLKLLLLFIVFLTLAKGNTPPFGFFFDYLLTFNYLQIFREPWAKFMPNYIFTIYLAIAYLSKDFIRSKSYQAIMMVLVILLIFQNIPVVLGEIVDHAHVGWRILDVKVPDYWIELSHWTKDHARYKRILILPATASVTSHQWPQLPFGGNPETFLLYSNIITSKYAGTEEKALLTDYFNNLSPDLLVAGSIDYVLQEKDTNVGDDKKDLNLLLPALDTRAKLVFGPLDLYPVKKEFTSQKIRIVNDIISSDKLCNFALFSKDVNQPTTTAFIQSSSRLQPASLFFTKIKTERINENKYKIIFPQSVDDNIGLLFVETFNQDWKLYNSQNILAKQVVSEENHLPANCFGNLWIINKEVVNSNKVLYLQFAPDKIFGVAKIAYFVLTGCFFAVILGKQLLTRPHNKKLYE